MGIFRRSKIEASSSLTSGDVGAATLLTAAATTVAGRDRAMRIPTISRARDLLCSLAASLPLQHFSYSWATGAYVETELAPEPWMLRPDTKTTLAHTLGWTVDDLLFHGRAAWRITSRRMLDGRPASFEWLPASDLNVVAQYYAGGVPLGDYSVTFAGTPVPLSDLVMFWSPIAPLLDTAARGILVAERLDQSALRFASTPTAFGYLQQTGGEPMTSDELSDLAQGWIASRDTQSVGALNEWVEWKESQMSPDKLQLVESRQHQALELSRLANVPPYLLGAPTGSGMTYQNAQQSRQDLILFGALPYLEVIQQTLSGDAVTPRGHLVRFDTNAWTDHLPGTTPTPPAGTP